MRSDVDCRESAAAGEEHGTNVDGIHAIPAVGRGVDERGGIAYADIEIELADLDDALRVVSEALEAAGAPQGSELIQASDESVLREFGTLQCLAIYLDGTSLPDEVYADLDFDAVVEEIGKRHWKDKPQRMLGPHDALPDKAQK